MRTPKTSLVITAFVLFLLAGWWMSSVTQESAPTTHEKISFPTHLRPLERRRMNKRLGRRPPAPVDPAQPEASPLSQRDPMLRALAAFEEHGALVVEANALRHSDIGLAVMECLVTGEQSAAFEEKFGVNLLEDLDRVGVSNQGVMFSGNFENVDWGSVLNDADRESYSDKSTIFRGGIQMARRTPVVTSLACGTMRWSS